MKKVSLFLIVTAFLHTPVYAYVDPGILGSAYQLLYMLFFGVLVGMVTRPWLLVKAMYKKYFGRFSKQKNI
jgi:hypothetical protein